MNPLEILRKRAGMTMAELAERLGLQAPAINKMEKGQMQIAGHAVKLAEIFGVSTDEILGRLPIGETRRRIPVIGNVSAGEISMGDHKEWERSVEYTTRRNDLVALEVSGDSMNQVADHGSILIVDRTPVQSWDELNKQLVIANLPDEGGTFKRYYRNTHMLVPESTNPIHEPIPVTPHTTPWGKVIGVYRDLEGV